MTYRRLDAHHGVLFGIDTLAAPLAEIKGRQFRAGEKDLEAAMLYHRRGAHVDDFAQ